MYVVCLNVLYHAQSLRSRTELSYKFHLYQWWFVFQIVKAYVWTCKKRRNSQMHIVTCKPITNERFADTFWRRSILGNQPVAVWWTFSWIRMYYIRGRSDQNEVSCSLHQNRETRMERVLGSHLLWVIVKLLWLWVIVKEWSIIPIIQSKPRYYSWYSFLLDAEPTSGP
jgi:hypothetical protein